MIRNLMEGGWKQLRGRAREMWGVLTGDEMTEIKGRCEFVLGRIQMKTSLERPGRRAWEVGVGY